MNLPRKARAGRRGGPMRARIAALLLLALAACHPSPPVKPPAAAQIPAPPVAQPCKPQGGQRCFAVVVLGPAAAAQQAVAATEHDLASDNYAIVQYAPRPLRPADASGIDYAPYAALNLDYLVLESWSDPTGNSVQLALADVRQRSILFSTQHPLTAGGDARGAGHLAADLVLQKLTGVRGLHDTAIAYISAVREPGRGRTPAQTMFHLMLSDADGGNPRELVSSTEPLMTPAWSPDGRRLAYVGFDNGRSTIFVLDLATGQKRAIVQERGINGAPAWSPDGSHIAATLSLGRNPDIYVIDLAGNGKRRLTSDSAIETETTWSPDGRTLAFTSDRSGMPQIYTMSADGGPMRPLPRLGRQTSNPCYSPDGRTLAMVVEGRGRFRIGLLHLDTQRFDSLSAGPRDEKPSFAPNGGAVIYAAQDGTLGTLKVQPLGGGALRELRADGDLREPAWSPYRN